MIKNPLLVNLNRNLTENYSQVSKQTAELASQEQTWEFQLESIPKTLKLKE